MPMIRKGLYITARNAAYLLRESERLGISDSEIMRRALDREEERQKSP